MNKCRSTMIYKWLWLIMGIGGTLKENYLKHNIFPDIVLDFPDIVLDYANIAKMQDRK